MSQSWFYQHDGKTHGPVSSEQMKELAKRRLLDAHDLIWPEGGDAAGAIPADAALDFSTLVSATVETTTSKSPEVPVNPAPPPPKPSAANVPDWLGDVAAAEKIGPIAPPAPSTTSAAPAYLQDLRLWVKLEPTSSKPPAPSAKPVSETGFDPDTGRILDPEKFKSWQRQHPAGASSGITNASMLEAFRKARTMIEAWVDDDKNRLRITHGETQELKEHKEIQAILGRFSRYGPAMRQKLERHLTFLAENRRKYYRAAGAK